MTSCLAWWVEGAVLPLGRYLNGNDRTDECSRPLVLWFRGKSVLDLWLMVAVCALTMETALTALLIPLNASRLGHYASRLISLVVAKPC